MTKINVNGIELYMDINEVNRLSVISPFEPARQYGIRFFGILSNSNWEKLYALRVIKRSSYYTTENACWAYILYLLKQKKIDLREFILSLDDEDLYDGLFDPDGENGVSKYTQTPNRENLVKLIEFLETNLVKKIEFSEYSKGENYG